MEQEAAALQARRATASAFGDLVNAMRGVAAARAQRARALLAGVDAYAGTVAQAIAQARALLPPADGGVTAAPAQGEVLRVLFCAEQGFNGGFSEQVLGVEPQALRGRVLLLGTQGLRLVRARGGAPEWFAPLIAHADAAVSACEALQQALAQALTRRRAAAVELIHAEMAGGQRFTPCRRRLLPLELPPAEGAPRGAPPLIHLPPAQLLDELTHEYVAAQLMRALLHSHACENLSRLQAMAAAHENVQRMVQGLEADERRLRQEAITAEIVELAAGLRALRAVQGEAGGDGAVAAQRPTDSREAPSMPPPLARAAGEGQGRGPEAC